ncbi:MAG: hypothetical protein MJ252_20115, partial [archaeon]|nr:hypothetical protein [archaeon]
MLEKEEEKKEISTTTILELEPLNEENFKLPSLQSNIKKSKISKLIDELENKWDKINKAKEEKYLQKISKKNLKFEEKNKKNELPLEKMDLQSLINQKEDNEIEEYLFSKYKEFEEMKPEEIKRNLREEDFVFIPSKTLKPKGKKGNTIFITEYKSGGDTLKRRNSKEPSKSFLSKNNQEKNT